MTLTIELSPEKEARLQAQARQQEQELQDAAHELVRSGLGLLPEPEITEAKHAVLIQRLQAAGALTQLPTRQPGPPPRPITARGQPICETIIEERR